jgi:hypothetical protein
MWDLMINIGPFSQKLLKDGEYYKDFRRSMEKYGFKLESNSGIGTLMKWLKTLMPF